MEQGRRYNKINQKEKGAEGMINEEYMFFL